MTVRISRASFGENIDPNNKLLWSQWLFSLNRSLDEVYASLNKCAVIVDPPATAADPGIAGNIAFDSSYVYICIATDTWMRASIATW